MNTDLREAALRIGYSYGILMVMVFGIGSLADCQSPRPGVLTIDLKDASGAPVKDGVVVIDPLKGGQSTVLRTNDKGIVYAQLPPMRYDVTGLLPAFTPEKKEFDVTLENQKLSLVLKPESTHGYGDWVVTPAMTASSQSDVCSPCVSVLTSNMVKGLSDPPVTQTRAGEVIFPTRPIPSGLAPNMQVKLVSEKAGEKVYAVIFAKGDELLSGLADFAIKYKVEAAHFTGIGAISGATVGWLDLSQKAYQPIHVDEQVEVLSLIGDVATFNGKPVVHAHMVMGKRDGSTVGGHLWEAHVNPTLEVFVSVDPVGLKKKLDDASGMKLIDPKQ